MNSSPMLSPQSGSCFMGEIKMRGNLAVGISITLALALLSCTSHPRDAGIELNPSLNVQNSPQPQVISEYRLQPGDEIEIKFFYNPSLNERLVIRPDGKISLQLIDELSVVGLTPAQLDKILTKRYASEIKEPDLAVIVRSFIGQRVYIGGEVNAPQLIPLMGRMTVLQSIFRAGGFKDAAHPGSVIIIRKDAENRPFGIKVDLNRVIKGEKGARDLELLPYDIVYVPKKMISRVNLFVDQYIRKNIPVHTGFGFTYELNP